MGCWRLQDSHFRSTFMVWETLMLHAYLRKPCISRQSHSSLIRRTLHSMGLLSIKDSRVNHPPAHIFARRSVLMVSLQSGLDGVAQSTRCACNVLASLKTQCACNVLEGRC